jgi:DNA-binding GntR family transcriptional regulator
MSVPPEPATSPIDPPSSDSAVLLRDMAYEHIKEAIRQAQVQPGQPLSETRLSRQLGISRTPVREALQVLAQEGLVQIIPGRAVTVAAPSVQDVMDAVHVRSILEPEVARLAAKHISPEQLRALAEAQEGLEAAVVVANRAAWSLADNSYHEVLSAACPNKLLGDLAMEFRNRVSYLSTDSQGNWERIAACTHEHSKIVDMVTARDADGAAAAMRDHIDKYRESIFRRLSHR